MKLLTRAGFGKFVLGLPAVTLHDQWEANVAKVGGKVFALVGDDGGHLTFKASEVAFAGLTSLEGISEAAYFKRPWVSVGKDANITDRDLKLYIGESHRIIAQKLTRKARAELGLA